MSKMSKVDPPLDEIEVEHRYNRGGKGVRKPYLVVSIDCLEEIFDNESAILATDDVDRLLACLCRYAERAGFGDAGLAAELAANYEDVGTELDLDASPDGESSEEP
jgi:hypothetical protein